MQFGLSQLGFALLILVASTCPGEIAKKKSNAGADPEPVPTEEGAKVRAGGSEVANASVPVSANPNDPNARTAYTAAAGKAAATNAAMWKKVEEGEWDAESALKYSMAAGSLVSAAQIAQRPESSSSKSSSSKSRSVASVPALQNGPALSPLDIPKPLDVGGPAVPAIVPGMPEVGSNKLTFDESAASPQSAKALFSGGAPVAVPSDPKEAAKAVHERADEKLSEIDSVAAKKSESSEGKSSSDDRLKNFLTAALVAQSIVTAQALEDLEKSNADLEDVAAVDPKLLDKNPGSMNGEGPDILSALAAESDSVAAFRGLSPAEKAQFDAEANHEQVRRSLSSKAASLLGIYDIFERVGGFFGGRPQVVGAPVESGGGASLAILLFMSAVVFVVYRKTLGARRRRAKK